MRETGLWQRGHAGEEGAVASTGIDEPSTASNTCDVSALAPKPLQCAAHGGPCVTQSQGMLLMIVIGIRDGDRFKLG